MSARRLQVSLTPEVLFGLQSLNFLGSQLVLHIHRREMTQLTAHYAMKR